jgi:hypothetical protein
MIRTSLARTNRGHEQISAENDAGRLQNRNDVGPELPGGEHDLDQRRLVSVPTSLAISVCR